MSPEELQRLFGPDYLGPDQINGLLSRMGLQPMPDADLPPVPYSDEQLRSKAGDYLLVLGYGGSESKPLNILAFRESFGMDPVKSEPCLYNQDWYLNEAFVHITLEPRWYLIKKIVIEESRAVRPEALLKADIAFPTAILCVYTFFAYYYNTGSYLWYHDFVWCSDTDHNGDRIYVGKYHDIDGVNKNGFSIHRHLALRDCYASVTIL